jgi:hypothetical protein
MRPAAIIGSALLLVALAFGAITLYALEGRDVAVLHTHAPDGTTRTTRTWVADDGDILWVEAAFPQRPFYQQLLANPEVEVERGGIVRRYRATPAANPDGHTRIRAWLADKYGWADRWVGLLQDTSASVAVKLEPE